MNGVKRFTCLATLYTALPIALWGCQRHNSEPPAPVAVHATALKREPLSSETRISATVREWRRIELSFKVPGTVASLLQVPGPDGKPRDAHEGDRIVAEATLPLASLDDADYRRKLTTAEERLAQAQAKERAVLANLTAARSEFERAKSLLDQHAVSRQTFDDSMAKRDAYEAELEAARRDIRAWNVAQQQAVDDLKNCALLAPLSDVTISRKYIEGGERVAANQPVFQVLDLSRLRVAFGVPDTKVGEFRIGQQVNVTADAFRNRRFAGQVTKIFPAADLKTRSFEIEVTIDDPQGLKPGMVVTIITGETTNGILVPMTSIQRGAGNEGYAVFTVVEENGRQVARKRRIKMSGVFDNRIRLAEGGEVRMGDTVIVTGAFRLSDGQAVRVVDAPEIALRIGE